MGNLWNTFTTRSVFSLEGYGGGGGGGIKGRGGDGGGGGGHSGGGFVSGLRIKKRVSHERGTTIHPNVSPQQPPVPDVALTKPLPLTSPSKYLKLYNESVSTTTNRKNKRLWEGA